VPRDRDGTFEPQVNRSLDPTGTGRTRWTTRWKPALNAFAITFAAGNTVGEIVPINAV
jgi:transposase-like protein